MPSDAQPPKTGDSRSSHPTAAWTIAWLGAAVVIAAVLFAPLMTVGFCADSSDPAKTYCGSSSQSVLGIDTTFWLWLGATVAFGIIAWLASHAFWRPRRKDSVRGEDDLPPAE